MRKQQEHKLQVNIVRFLKLQYPHVLFNGSLGGQYQKYRSQQNKGKAAGYRRGFPDLFIYEPAGKFHGLAIELKVKGNYATEAQKEVLQILNNKGYKAVVCTGIDETLQTINDYLRQAK